MAYEDEEYTHENEQTNEDQGEWVRSPEQAPPPQEAQARDEWERSPEQGPPPQEAQVQDEWERSPKQKPPPAAEPAAEDSQLEAGVRAAAHTVVPSAAGAYGWGVGAPIGAVVGTAALGPGLGTSIGYVGGGLLGALATGSLAAVSQEWLLKKFGHDDEALQAANREKYPLTTAASGVLGAVPTFGVGGGAALAARALSGVVGGGTELVMSGDPQRALAVGATSTLLNKPTGIGQAAIRAGEQTVERLGVSAPTAARLSTLVAEHLQERSNPNAETPTGATPEGATTKEPNVAADLHKADVETPGQNTPGGFGGKVATAPTERGIVSEPQNQPIGDSGNKGIFAKEGAPIEGGQEPSPLGTITPDVEAVLRKPPAAAEETKAPVQQAAQGQPPADPFANDPFFQRLRANSSRLPNPDRIGEIDRESIVGFDAMHGTVRLKDGTELPVSQGAGTIFYGKAGNIIDPSAIQAFRNSSDSPWYPVKHPPQDQTAGLVQAVKDRELTRTAAAENPPAGPEINEATQRALAAGAKYGSLMKQAGQERAKLGEGAGGKPPPPREPPKPPEPPEPGPKDARLNKPPLLESKGGGPFNALRRTFAPEFMSPASEKATGALRRGQGIMEALNKKWTHTLEKHFPAMEELIKKGEMEAFTDKIEGGDHFPEYEIPAHLKEAAADIKEMFKAYKEHAAKIAQDPEAVHAWNENYVTHIYKDEPKSFWDRVGGGGVRGSGGSLKARKYNTYAEAKEAEGLVPRHKNILNTVEAYRAELGKHIALEIAKQEMREGGHLKYAMPDVRQGASGQMSSLKESTRIHPDWEPVENLSMGGRQAYMPRDAANVFNNHLSPGLKGNKYIAPFYQAWREAANRFTSMELGLFNGFHTFVTGGESVLSNQSRGVSELSQSVKRALQGNLKDAGIELTAAGESILTSPAAPVANYHVGRRFLAIAEGNDKPWSVFSPLKKFKQPTDTERLMVRASQEAGVMPHGRSYAPDENLSAMGTFTKSYMRGQFGREMSEMAQRIKDNPFKGVPVETWNMLGRSMQTMSEPLFGHYIPALKYGTLMKDMESFLRQSKADLRTPQGYEAGVQFLRKQSNAMDVRIGEANAQNMFMNKSIQDAGYALLRSFSWTKGTATSLLAGPGGVIKTLAEGVANKDMGAAMKKLANKLDMTHKDYDPNLTYAIAFPFGTALIATVYQLYKTGEMPKDLKDLYLPRTGGLIPGIGGKGGVPERVPLPGYHKEIRGALHDPVQEVLNKQNALLTTLEQQATGLNWRGNPIIRPDATLTESLTDRAKHMREKLFNPLMLKNVTAVPPEGSKISTAERTLGFKQAGRSYLDPEQAEKGARKRYEEAWKKEKSMEWQEEHGGRGTIPASKLRESYGTAPKPSTLVKPAAPAPQDEWVRSPNQRPR